MLTCWTPTAHPPAATPSYVFCRQRQDESLRRGGEQSSLVVVSRAPLSSVLAPLAQVAGPLFFSQGPQALQQVGWWVGGAPRLYCNSSMPNQTQPGSRCCSWPLLPDSPALNVCNPHTYVLSKTTTDLPPYSPPNCLFVPPGV